MVHLHKKFDLNRTKIKGSCQSGRKVVNHVSVSKSDLRLDTYIVGVLFCHLALLALVVKYLKLLLVVMDPN